MSDETDWKAFEITDAAGTQGARAARYVGCHNTTAAKIAIDYVESLGFERKAWNAEFTDGDEVVVAVMRPGMRKTIDAEVFRVVVNLKPTFEPHSAGTLKEFRERAAGKVES